MTDTMRQMYDYQQESFKKWDEVIRGVETVDDPYLQHEIQIPAGYNKAFTDSLGNIILTNDLSMTADRLGGNWRELKKH